MSSEAHRTPPCPLHAECGACDAMALDEGEQLARKVRSVARAAGREPDRVVPSPRALGYRARVRLRVGPEGELGYHRPRSHILVHVRACAIARPEIAAVLAHLPPMPAGIESVELRTDGARTALVATRERRAVAGLEEAFLGLGLAELPGLDGAALGGRTLFGDARLRLAAGGVEHRPGPGVFFQVNLEVNALLVEAVREQVLARAPSSVLDLYGGYGNLSFPLAAAGLPVALWESDAAAVADARRTAERLVLRLEARQADASRFRAGDAFFDAAVVDPPREGAPGVLAALVTTRPKVIAYVSCHPPSLARDLRPATQAGYRLAHLAVFDMFPQTFHVETLAVLTRRDVTP